MKKARGGEKCIGTGRWSLYAQNMSKWGVHQMNDHRTSDRSQGCSSDPDLKGKRKVKRKEEQKNANTTSATQRTTAHPSDIIKPTQSWVPFLPVEHQRRPSPAHNAMCQHRNPSADQVRPPKYGWDGVYITSCGRLGFGIRIQVEKEKKKHQ